MDGLAGLSTPPFPWLTAFAVGAGFGIVAERIQLCTMGAIADAVIFQSWRRARVWAAMVVGAAVIVAASSAVGLAAAPPVMAVGPAVLVGGALFGIGMVLAGGCVSRAWLRACSGSLKAGLVLVVAFAAAAMTLTIASPPGKAAAATPPLASLALAGGASLLVLADRRFRGLRGPLLPGLALGVFAALAIPVADSARFVPTAVPIVDGAWVALLAGVTAGMTASAVQAGRARLELPEFGAETARTLAGAAAMGVGGALAGGDTIAIGVGGVALLAPGAWLALGAMLAGAALTLKILLEGGVGPLLRGIGRRVSGRA